MPVVGRAPGAEHFPEMRWGRPIRRGSRVGEVRSDNFVAAPFGVEKADLRMRLVIDKFGFPMMPGPEIVGGQVDDIAFHEGVRRDDFRCEDPWHGHYLHFRARPGWARV